MDKPFDIAAIVGVGLLGGSLGLALKERGLANTVRGSGRRQSTLEKALSIGAIDEICTDPTQAAAHADLIVICAPASAVAECLDAVRPVCGKSALVTDVASTKAGICAHARETWSEPYRFIGSHPMAGSEKFGPEHAEADLYEGSVCFVETCDGHARDAHEAVMGLWRGVGAKVIEVDPGAHDAIVARTSHLPHIVAAALTQLAARDERRPAPFIGNGFRDATRIAEGRPEIWRDICLTNAASVREAIEALTALLNEVAQDVADGEAERIEAFFEKGRQARRKALEE